MKLPALPGEAFWHFFVMSTSRPDEYVLPLVDLSNISRNLPAVRQAGMKSTKQSTVNLST